ncbi:hypothetical protein PoB_000420800 [Plakobranchus ocellatus]|uniref:Uncharacterized protein n=1 Tax=Plakobranchus ocellatus TaxID=259542 RepID=A0AAV3Y564_9GAST|nr:hypothetical protein PoB_000420800 [Plakobranchus ocellatus]
MEVEIQAFYKEKDCMEYLGYTEYGKWVQRYRHSVRTVRAFVVRGYYNRPETLSLVFQPLSMTDQTTHNPTVNGQNTNVNTKEDVD